MKPVFSFIVFFITFPLIIISAVVKNGIFNGNGRSLEQWSFGGVLLLISLMFMPASQVFYGMIAVPCWAWCVFIWFVYIEPMDFGYISTIIESQHGGKHKRFWNRCVRQHSVAAAVFSSRIRYISWTFIFWHVSLAILTFLWGLNFMFSKHSYLKWVPANR